MSNNLTDNKNLLSPTGYKLIINRSGFSNTEYFCVSAALPTVSLGEINVINNQYKGYLPGDITYEDLTISIAVDENLVVYQEIFDWIIANRDGLVAYDASLMILTNHNNPNRTVRFKNIFPTSLSGVEFNSQTTEVEYMKAQVTFKYDSYYFE
jgi:hypothetical protein